jgi:hypothetical protein
MKRMVSALGTLAAACLALGAAAGLSTEASAQAPGLQPPRTILAPPSALQLAPPERAVKLRAPPGVRFTPPTPAEAERSRKAAVLRAAGLNAPVSALGASFWLTPQNPYLNPTTYIQVADETTRPPDYTVTPQFPFGRIPITVSPRTGAWWAGLFFPAAPFQYVLVECIVGGAVEYGVQYRLSEVGGRAETTLRIYRVPGAGKLSFVLPPAASGPQFLVMWGVGERGRWDFGGCEMTPVNPF